jgi:cytochrome c553
VKCQLALVLLALRSCSQAAIVTGQCVACHGILSMGDGTNPRMAGQSRGYVLKTLQEFQSKPARQQSLDVGHPRPASPG